LGYGAIKALDYESNILFRGLEGHWFPLIAIGYHLGGPKPMLFLLRFYNVATHTESFGFLRKQSEWVRYDFSLSWDDSSRGCFVSCYQQGTWISQERM
jgi:hypothetical protein